MRTPRTGIRIPAWIVGVALLAAIGGCGSDDEPATSASTATSTTASAPSTTSAATTTSSSPATSVETSAQVPASPATDERADSVAPGSSAPEPTVATTATPATAASNDVVIMVTAGVDSGEDRVEPVPLGATVNLTVVNPDRDDEFHVHGYELGDGIEVPAGQPEMFTFVADRAGQFEVESHTTEMVLLVLDVG